MITLTIHRKKSNELILEAELKTSLYAASTIKAILPVYLPLESHELEEVWDKLFSNQIAVFKKHIIELTNDDGAF